MASAEAAKSLWDFDFFAPRPVSNLYGTLIHIRRSDVSGRRCDAATGSDSFVQVEKNKHHYKENARWTSLLSGLESRSLLYALATSKPATSCKFRDRNMLFDYILGGAVTLFLLAYLTYALVRPERF
ncbi:K(+)-transporting ATPase subunit F [Mesorhizobium sp. M0046]|uniref:K(+)-transporting ATPase subunit F n=1 Tax=unclassified Mesorhizobium TaxID=325217 RepID=UPI00333BB138